MPQISIPLKGRRGTGAASAGVGGNGIDDDVARCLAMKSRRERADCLRAG